MGVSLSDLAALAPIVHPILTFSFSEQRRKVNMDILSYTHAYFGAGHNAGGETTLHDIMRLLREEGNSMTALVSKPHKDGSGAYAIEGVLVQPHTSKMDPELWFPRADLLLTHLECSIRGGMIAKKYGLTHGQVIHNDQEYCINAAQRWADFLICNSDWVSARYATLGIPSVTLHPPVDPERYRVETSREYITLINLADGSDYEISYDKGSSTFYELARRFPHEKFLGVRGAYGHQHIEQLPNVTIVDHIDNIRRYYEKTKIILTPSKYESYGRAQVEAACSGIPSIITADLDGPWEAMGSSSLYAPFRDYDSWEAALTYMLDHYDTCSAAALQRANLNWERTVREWPHVVNLVNEMGAKSGGSYYDRAARGQSGLLPVNGR